MTITGLDVDTDYWFSVQAKNSGGESGFTTSTVTDSTDAGSSTVPAMTNNTPTNNTPVPGSTNLQLNCSMLTSDYESGMNCRFQVSTSSSMANPEEMLDTSVAVFSGFPNDSFYIDHYLNRSQNVRYYYRARFELPEGTLGSWSTIRDILFTS